MYPKGHLGITLIIASLPTYILIGQGAFFLAMLVLPLFIYIGTVLPDKDIEMSKKAKKIRKSKIIPFNPKIRHRGRSHTIFFAITTGIITSIPFCLTIFVPKIYKNAGVPTTSVFGQVSIFLSLFLFGFSIGFFGVITHLIGDAITISQVKPFYPYKEDKFGMSLIRADNMIANYSILILGFLIFGASLASQAYFLFENFL